MSEVVEVESEVIKEEEISEVKPKGFSLLLSEKGDITLTPHNLDNDFEFAGLIDYAYSKKDELLKSIGRGPEFRTLQAVKQLTDLLTQAFQAKQAETETKVAEDKTGS